MFTWATPDILSNLLEILSSTNEPSSESSISDDTNSCITGIEFMLSFMIVGDDASSGICICAIDNFSRISRVAKFRSVPISNSTITIATFSDDTDIISCTPSTEASAPSIFSVTICSTSSGPAPAYVTIAIA